MRSEWRRLILVAWWMLAVGAAPALASSDVVSGELGRWLDEAAGELGETLSRHPRFKGETVRLVALTPGPANEGGNALTEAVERRLRQRLLEVEGLRLAVERPRRDCEPPRSIGYLVRVEVGGAGADGRVHIAVVDVAEAMWVSGISLRWSGRFSSAERRALGVPVSAGVPGSAASPIPLQDAAAVAAALKADLACTLPADLSGALYVDTAEPPGLSGVGLALQAELMYEPLAAVTPDRGQARWLLSLDPGGSPAAPGADVRELKLTLADAEGGHRQQVASVFVSGARAEDAAPPPESATARRGTPVPGDGSPVVGGRAGERAATELLSALEMRPARPEGICDDRRNRLNSCVEISFELREPAYLFVVSTREREVVEAPCEGAAQRADPGRRRYRVRVPPGAYAVSGGSSGPDAGFYVVAVRERAAASRIATVLATAPGACGAPTASAAGEWLNELDRTMRDEGGRVVWRALHVAHDTGGIVAL